MNRVPRSKEWLPMGDILPSEFPHMHVGLDSAAMASPPSHIYVTRDVESLSDNVFDGTTAQAIDFESGSKLVNMGKNVLRNSSVRSLVIPASVEHIDKDTFQCVDIPNLMVDTANTSYTSCGSLLLDNGNKRVMYCGNTSVIFIPSTVEVISDGVFGHLSGQIVKVVFGPGSRLTLIPERAFAKLRIFRLTIPASVEDIGVEAFQGAETLCELLFEPSSRLAVLRERSFARTSLEKIILPVSVTHICSEVFLFCRKIESIDFIGHPNLTTIGRWAFAATGPCHVIIPANTENIDDGAFAQCDTLSEVKFLDNSRLIRIGRSAFKGTCLNKINIPAKTMTICECAFENIRTLTSVELCAGSQLVSIQHRAFAGTGIKDFDIPATTTDISCSAFHCSMLKAFTVADGNKTFTAAGRLLLSYDEKTIVCCGGREDTCHIPNTVESIPDNFLLDCSHITEVCIKDDSALISIGESAFAGTNITSLNIPKNTRELKRGFSCRCAISELRIAPENPCYCLRDGSLLTHDERKLIWFCRERIPESVEELGPMAFCNARIREIYIPKKIKTIPPDSFECSPIERIEFEDLSWYGKYVGLCRRGVFAYLSVQHRENIAKKGVVEVACGSVTQCMRVSLEALNVVGDNGWFYQSEDLPHQWVSVDFKTRKLSITRYTVCSDTLVSWVLEGSTDGQTWTKIDQKVDQDAKIVSRSFPVDRTAEFGVVRLTQTGKNALGSDFLKLMLLEFFGDWT